LIASFDYTYDAVGQRQQAIEYFDADGDGIIDAAASGEDTHQSFNWQYDNLDRLIEEHFDANSDGPSADDYIHTFAYDLASNRVEQAVDEGADVTNDETITYTHDGNDRVLSEMSDVSGTTTSSYTEAGDLLTKTSAGGPTTEYTYNATGRMATVDIDGDGSDDVTYVYDAGGVRVSQTNTTTSSTTEFLIDPQNPTGYAEQIEEFVNTGGGGTPELVRSFVIGLMLISQSEHAPGAPGSIAATHVFAHDAHGSTRLLLTPAAAVHEVYTYTAFGDPLGFNPDTAATPWLFAGDGIYETSTGLTYHLQRRRDGHVFTQMDPFAGAIGNPLTLHKFGYAHQNPVTGVDPSGELTMVSVLKGMAIGATVGAVSGAVVGGTAGYLKGGIQGAQAGAINGLLVGGLFGAGIGGGTAALAPVLMSTFSLSPAAAYASAGFVVSTPTRIASFAELGLSIRSRDSVNIGFSALGVVAGYLPFVTGREQSFGSSGSRVGKA